MRYSIAVAALLIGAPWAIIQMEVAPVHRLKMAEWLFSEGLKTSTDHVRSRQSFHMAAVEYQTLIDEGHDNSELFLNLGNAHVLADELPQAIMAYRRGLRQHPLHQELLENLTAARDMVGYPDDDARHRLRGEDWPPWLPRPARAVLLQWTLFFYGVAWLAAAGWLVTRRPQVGIAALFLFLAAAVIGGWWGYLDYLVARDQQNPLAVVAVNGVTLRRGNGSMYPRHPELPIVNRGMEARVLSERGGWIQVQFPGGDVGWLPRDAVLFD